MQSKLILCSLFFLITGYSYSLFGQEQAKPRYSIEAKRNGKTIGIITLELFPLIAPKAVHNFDSLVTIKFFDSSAFHRVIPNFMIQGGDPNSRSGARNTWGFGSPEQKAVPAEFSKVPFIRGILGAARGNDINSATSQFFICVATASHLNGKYTVYGKAINGMNIADSIVNAKRDAQDNPLDKIEMFITRIGVNDSIPVHPTLLLPTANEQRIGASTTLSWEPVSSALLYNVDIAEDSSFTTIIYSDVLVTTATSVNGLKPGLNTYYWRVKSNNGGHYSAYSPTRAFTTIVATPNLLLPDSAANVQDTTVRFQWSSVRGAKAYHIQVGTNSLYTTTTLVFDKKSHPDTMITVSGLLKNKKYYWRISAEANDYETPPSPSRYFLTSLTSDIHELTDFTSMNVLVVPNPLLSNATIEFTTKNDCIAYFEVTDVTGRTLQKWKTEVLNAGQHNLLVDWSLLTSGVYFLQAKFSTGEVIQRSFVIER